MKTTLKDFVSGEKLNEYAPSDVMKYAKLRGSKEQKKEVKDEIEKEIKKQILDKIGDEIEKAIKKGVSHKDIKKYVKKFTNKLNESTDSDDLRTYAIATLTFKEENQNLDLDTACVKADEMFETGEYDGVVVISPNNTDVDSVEYIVF